MSARMDGRLLSDDSSEEDEPIVATSYPTNVDMEDEEEEEEDEDMRLMTAASSHLKLETQSTKLRKNYDLVQTTPWNAQAWQNVMTEVQKIPSIEEARAYYELFLERFPTSGYWWKAFAEHEMRAGQYERVREIFNKALLTNKLPYLELWAMYLSFLKSSRVDPINASHPLEEQLAARKLMLEAFELALDCVGQSIHSLGIWQSYINFLREDKDQQAFILVRKAYQRALVVPMVNSDTLLKEYELFEKAIPNNEALHANMMKALRPKIDAAKTILKDRKALVDAINLDALPSKVDTNPQIDEWQRWIEFELSNPERVDTAKWKAKCRFVLELCLACRQYSCEVWYQYVLLEQPDVDAVTRVYSRATAAMPDSCLLHFAFADHYEINNQTERARDIYERLLETCPSSLVYITYQRFTRRAYGNKGLEEARHIFKRARKDNACSYQVYTSAALLEFHSSNGNEGKQIALNIFELGLKKYIHEPEYVLSYVDFLQHTNDDNNMRSLFEKVLSVMPAEVAKPVWDKFLEFEMTMAANGGDLASIVRLEGRRAVALQSALAKEPHAYLQAKGMMSLMHRYQWMHLLEQTTDSLFFDTYADIYKLQTQTSTTTATAASTSVVKPNVLKELDKPYTGPPLPECLQEFASMLPLGVAWNGPVADVEHMYRAMMMVELPPRSEIEQMDAKMEDEDGSEVNVMAKRPTHDVFRNRQKQRLAKLN
ncbi:hypothetical protein THRCLA_03040 [Thraustotheca clavata]|uniref:Suppressor of forked domain-containing protein n=1 Tax=Thraustotheca clavata TaxID=74557 RepID=A0A1W0A388_9STRA|nr:hypothetical protein THRCLA_03040 [Thraustotheca clavata]